MKKILRQAVHKTATLAAMSLMMAIIVKLIPRAVSHEKLADAEEKLDAVIDEKADFVRDASKKGAHKTFTLIEDMSLKEETNKKKIS